MKSRFSRRAFLQSTGLGALALTVNAGRPVFAQEPVAEENKQYSTSVVPTVCAMCRARCPMLATVINGRLAKVEGNPAGPVKGGKLCARGHAAVKLLYDPDRLKYPLKRVGPRGEGSWQRISWQEALAAIAYQLKKNLEAHGPESLALLAGGPSSFYIKKLFADNGVTNIHDAALRHCDEIRNRAYTATFGFSPGDPPRLDYSGAKCIVLLGCHMGENVQVPQLVPLLAALQAGAQLIVADPRYSSMAAKAAIHLPVKPGTDTALLLGWCHHIVAAGLHDQQWVAENVSGFAELKQHLEKYPVEKVAEITGIAAQDIIRSAEMMASRAPAVIIHPGGHLSWYGNDVQRVRAQAILTALLGGVGRPGGLQLPVKAALPDGVLEFARPQAGNAVAFSALMEQLIARRIKVVGCWGRNPLQNHASIYKTIAALQAAEFVFCCDVLPGEASLYADIVLPEAVFLERHDILEVWSDLENPLVACRFPVVAPAFETREPYWIVKNLADQLGGNNPFFQDNGAAFLDSQLRKAGWLLGDLRVGGGIRRVGDEKVLPEVPAPVTAAPEVSPATPSLLPGADMPAISLAEAQPATGPAAGSQPSLKINFPTASGQAEVYSSAFAGQGWDPLPGYEPTPEPPAGFVRLLYGRSPVHTQSSTMNNPWLNHEIPENEVWVHPSHAAAARISDGERVFLENQDGIRSFKAVKVKVTPGIRPDCSYLVHGYGCRSLLLQQAFDRGVSDTSLMTRSSKDPVSGVRGMRVNFIRLVKARA
ncbi:MAG: twin-arginine translocation pathway signal protein [Desulfurivibrio sp.]|nr:MAG: twin-arginine translocation pathway signal protein [Desulfurivibrio sp.]